MRFRMIDSAKKQYTYWPKSTFCYKCPVVLYAPKSAEKCSSCALHAKHDDAKRTCLKCNAEMCFMCPAKSDCLAIH